MKQPYDKSFTIGVLGGGQLGRMLIQETIDLDVNVAVLDPSPEAPCKHISHECVKGDFNDFDAVYAFGKDKDVVTIEIEHVNVEALEKLENEGVKVYPQPSVIKTVKDKGLQKQFYADHNIRTSDFKLVENKAELEAMDLSFPFVQKLRTGGYDGRGVQVIRSAEDMSKAFDAPSVIEDMVDIVKELSVIVARNEQGDVKLFPPVELEFNPEANLVEFLFSPANISAEITEKANKLALDIIENFKMVGLLAVELFLTKDGEVLVNEIAPRPHNSGHHSIEGNITSQFAQFMRAILGWPLGDTAIVNPAVMINLLGADGHAGPVKYDGIEDALAMSGVYIHLYGKSDTKPFRKMGHVTVTNADLEAAKDTARGLLNSLRVIS